MNMLIFIEHLKRLFFGIVNPDIKIVFNSRGKLCLRDEYSVVDSPYSSKFYMNTYAIMIWYARRLERVKLASWLRTTTIDGEAIILFPGLVSPHVLFIFPTQRPLVAYDEAGNPELYEGHYAYLSDYEYGTLEELWNMKPS